MENHKKYFTLRSGYITYGYEVSLVVSECPVLGSFQYHISQGRGKLRIGVKMNVELALQTIQYASNDEILANVDGARRAFRKIENALLSIHNEEIEQPWVTQDLPSDHSLYDDASSVHDERTLSHDLIPPNEDNQVAVDQLLGRLRDSLQRCDSFFSSQSRHGTLARGDWQGEDSRIVDLLFAGTAHRNSDVSKFRKCLAELSLAKDFDEWERATYNTSKLAALIQNPCIAIRDDHIQKFTEERNFRNKDTASTGIRHGLRLMIIQKLTKTVGMAALLAFVPHSLSRLKKDEIVPFTTRLRYPSANEITDLASYWSGWFTNCIAAYESTSASANTYVQETNGLGRSGSLSQHHQSSNVHAENWFEQSRQTLNGEGGLQPFADPSASGM